MFKIQLRSAPTSCEIQTSGFASAKRCSTSFFSISAPGAVASTSYPREYDELADDQNTEVDDMFRACLKQSVPAELLRFS